MKSKLYFLPLLILLTAISSCKKWLPENRIVGNWKIVDVERKRWFSNDHITTGYEDGMFVFNDNGTASYTDANVQMTGNWQMRDVFVSEGSNETIFILKLYDFASNQVIDWYFDRIGFRSSGNKLIAFMQGASYTYKYDFRKQ